ncbi:glycosyltransferase family 8 C-terminal domain-containing protein, partial [Escherichia coli]|uniref:glycosyltransferase family 8 C-terminal domain-containing protein n=1 Tax=Escherichia coli TaxID=562 RepID=UPI003D2B05B4
AQPFIKAKEASPWKNEQLMRPINSNNARYCAKHNFKQNKPINGTRNYIYYFYLKIIK